MDLAAALERVHHRDVMEPGISRRPPGSHAKALAHIEKFHVDLLYALVEQ